MKIHLFTLVAFCFVFIQSTWGFSCPCQNKRQQERGCPPEKTLEECPYGAVPDPCYCCPNNRCKNGLGERCEGHFNLDGPCGDGFVCLPAMNGEFRGTFKTCQLENSTAEEAGNNARPSN